MNHSELAVENFKRGYNCSQSVVVAFCDVTGMKPQYAARLSSSFGGGMGRMREVCGGVSGMLMVAGLLYEKLKKNTLNIYVSLIISMISGRVVWGIARLIISGVTGTEFTWQLFIGGAVLQAVPGIILHILLIPIIVMALRRAKLID